MNDAPPPSATPPEAEAVRPRLSWFKAHTPLNWLLEMALVMLLTIGVLLLVVRLAPLSAEMRLFIQTRLEGLEIGPYGKLRVEGLGGDIWRDFSVRRLTITDAKGVWLEADDLRVRWRYAELLSARLHVTDLTAADLHVIRQPQAKPSNKPPGKAPAFSYTIDRIKGRRTLSASTLAMAGPRSISSSPALRS